MSDYPHEPGWKEGETSREAAEAMAERAHTLRGQVYKYIYTYPGHTADEVADGLDENILAIRPRVSELRLMGLIVNEGRGINRSGHPAHRWRAVRFSSIPSDDDEQPVESDDDGTS